MTPLSRGERARFDALLEEVLADLPEAVTSLLDDMPLIVLDRPTAAMLADVGLGPEAADELCGLHTGMSETEASVEVSGVLPSQVHLFRVGIIESAGGFRGDDADDRVYEEIRVTLLHEIGHQMGLDEGDLTDLGYD